MPSLVDVPVVYVNNNAISANATDLTILFGTQSPTGLKEHFVAIMAWEQANILRSMLDQAISHYEGNVGALRDLRVERTTPEQAQLDASTPTAEQ